MHLQVRSCAPEPRKCLQFRANNPDRSVPEDPWSFAEEASANAAFAALQSTALQPDGSDFVEADEEEDRDGTEDESADGT